jgi:hypothetical protein
VRTGLTQTLFTLRPRICVCVIGILPVSPVVQILNREVVNVAVIIDQEVLRREVARRGWNASDLADASGISRPTITAAFYGRPVRSRTLMSIAKALSRAAVIDGVDDLIDPSTWTT